MPPNSSGAAPLLKTSMRRGVALPPAAPPLLSVQRSEFEDFMNAYRPTLDPPPPHHHHPEEPSRSSDFGKSIKRLMKRPGGSPNTQSKNPRVREGGSQRVADPKVPDKQRQTKRPPDLAPPQPAFAPSPTVVAPLDANRAANAAPPPAPPPPKKSSVVVQGGQPPPKSPTKKTSLQPPPPAASPQPKAKPRPPPKEEASPAEVAKEKGRPESDAQHCLVVTGTGIGRFLPPRHNPDPILSLRVVPVSDRKYHVIMEFEEAPPALRPLASASGLMVAPPFDEEEARARDTREQLSCFHWIRESHVAPMGMLLMNVERTAEFPFVTYLVVGGGRQELAQKLKFVGDRPHAQHDPLRFLAGYEEPVTICRPPPSFPERPSSLERTGFVICLYQVLEGEDQVRLDQNWVTWTGARQIYRTLPPHMGLRRISVHKSLLSAARTVNYVLVCEFAHIMEHLTDACVLIDHLRARCCGFIGIYRVIDAL